MTAEGLPGPVRKGLRERCPRGVESPSSPSGGLRSKLWLRFCMLPSYALRLP